MRTKKAGREEDAKSLREKAEEKFKTLETAPLGSLTPDDIRKILHELRVHQIELEIQNEELRKAQEDLETSRSRYFDLFDLAPVGYLTIAEKGLILEANLTVSGLLGIGRKSIIRQPMTRFILPADQDIYYRHRKELFETGVPCVVELRLLRMDAPPFWVRIDATVAYDPDGKPVCRASLIDITERKRAEEALQEREEHYRILFDNGLDGICLADAETGIIIDCNHAIEALVGRERAEMIGQPQTILHPPLDEKTPVSLTFRQHLTDKKGQILETQVVTSTGDIREVEIKANLLNFRDKTYLQGIFHDITNRKMTEERLRLSSRKFEDIVKNLEEGYFSCSMDSILLEYNTAFSKMFGFDPGQHIQGVRMPDFWQNPEERSDYLDTLMNQGFIKNYLVNAKTIRGENIVVMVNSHLVKDQNSQLVRIEGTLTDFTERRLAEEELLRSKEKAEAGDRLKSAFIYNISHEVRTPLTVFLDSLN